MRLLNEVRLQLQRHSCNEQDILFVMYYLKNDKQKWDQHWCSWEEWVKCAEDYGDRRYLINSLTFVGERFKLYTHFSDPYWNDDGGQSCVKQWLFVRIPVQPEESQHRLPEYLHSGLK